MVNVLKILFPQQGWSTKKLHKEAGTNPYVFQHGSVRLVGQPDGRGTEYLWEITVDPEWAQAVIEAGRKADAEAQEYDRGKLWNGVILRSPAEEAVAEALQRKGLLFFTNSKCRLCNRSGQLETWEIDFLVFYRGVVRILEVDGRTYHQDSAADYKRDRVFDREGIRTTRFSAIECLENAMEVVEEFLEIFDLSHQTRQSHQTTQQTKTYTVASVVSVEEADIPF